MDKWNTWKITGEEKNTTVLFQIMSFSLLQRKQNKAKYAIYVVSLHFLLLLKHFLRMWFTLVWEGIWVRISTVKWETLGLLKAFWWPSCPWCSYTVISVTQTVDSFLQCFSKLCAYSIQWNRNSMSIEQLELSPLTLIEVLHLGWYTRWSSQASVGNCISYFIFFLFFFKYMKFYTSTMIWTCGSECVPV